MDTITLRRTATEWTVTFSGADGEHVKGLFGTATIPTPFTASAPAETVLAKIRQLNPDNTVVIGG